MTEPVLALPFVVESLGAMHDAGQLDENAIRAAQYIQVRMLRLVAQDRQSDRAQAVKVDAKTIHPGVDTSAGNRATRRQAVRDWNTAWIDQFDPAEFRVRHPLATRKLGRAAYGLYNEVHFDAQTCEPLTEEAAQVRRVRLIDIADAVSATPRQVGAYLRLAGLFPNIQMAHIGTTRLYERTYPEQALDYIAVYPLPEMRKEGEESTFGLARRRDIFGQIIRRVIARHRITPVVRLHEATGQEIECYTPENIAIIEAAIAAIPRKADDEVLVLEAFRRIGCLQPVGEHVLLISGVRAAERRLSERGAGRCIREQDMPLMAAAYKFLTTKQPHEKDFKELAAMAGRSVGYSLRMLTPEIRALGRLVRFRARGRAAHVLPDKLATFVADRLRQAQPIGPPPDLAAIGELVAYNSLGAPVAVGIDAQPPPAAPREFTGTRFSPKGFTLEEIMQMTTASHDVVVETLQELQASFQPPVLQPDSHHQIRTVYGQNHVRQTLRQLVGYSADYIASHLGLSQQEVVNLLFVCGFSPNPQGRYSQYALFRAKQYKERYMEDRSSP